MSKIFDIASDLFDFSTAGIMPLRNLIRRYRFDDGEMTQQQLPDLCGVSRQTINAVERNKYSPSLELAFKIARVFGASIEDIFLYEADPESGSLSQDGVTIRVTFENPSGGDLDRRRRDVSKRVTTKRSAVVTRRPASVMPRGLAGFCKFRPSDAVCKCLMLFCDENPCA